LAHVDPSVFDAIVGFERGHIAAAVVDGGAPYERAFLFPELVRLLGTGLVAEGADPVERARAALRGAHRARGSDFVPGEEIDDPIGQPVQTYERVYREIHDLARSAARALWPSGGPAEPRTRAEGITW
jgi:protein-tyrosine-phosphatase